VDTLVQPSRSRIPTIPAGAPQSRQSPRSANEVTDPRIQAKVLIHRCRLHNLADHLPDKDKQWVDAKLDKNYPSAAASLREGLQEMFTVARLGIDGRLAKTRSPPATPIESMIPIARTTNRNVTWWRDGHMVLRWTAAGMLNAERSLPPHQGLQADAPGGRRPRPHAVPLNHHRIEQRNRSRT
jgi:hypothetical protein